MVDSFHIPHKNIICNNLGDKIGCSVEVIPYSNVIQESNYNNYRVVFNNQNIITNFMLC